ncbi:MAG: hypothetical protein HOW59_14660 [Nonomuraea sp.]|nr:hypothetical protein [Nonomuraea sp.]
MIGLQARCSPPIAYARGLIAGGHVGRVAYAARGKGIEGRIPLRAACTLDRDCGSGTREDTDGHTRDALQHLVGDITVLPAPMLDDRHGTPSARQMASRGRAKAARISWMRRTLNV